MIFPCVRITTVLGGRPLVREASLTEYREDPRLLLPKWFLRTRPKKAVPEHPVYTNSEDTDIPGSVSRNGAWL